MSNKLNTQIKCKWHDQIIINKLFRVPRSIQFCVERKNFWNFIDSFGYALFISFSNLFRGLSSFVRFTHEFASVLQNKIISNLKAICEMQQEIVQSLNHCWAMKIERIDLPNLISENIFTCLRLCLLSCCMQQWTQTCMRARFLIFE